MTANAGGVAERSNASVLKTDNGATRSRVRIPPPPLEIRAILSKRPGRVSPVGPSVLREVLRRLFSREATTTPTQEEYEQADDYLEGIARGIIEAVVGDEGRSKV